MGSSSSHAHSPWQDVGKDKKALWTAVNVGMWQNILSKVDMTERERTRESERKREMHTGQTQHADGEDGPRICTRSTSPLSHTSSPPPPHGQAIKYALFDPTKEMAYIPLDQESKVKVRRSVCMCVYTCLRMHARTYLHAHTTWEHACLCGLHGKGA